MSVDALEAARTLLAQRRWRSSVSRSYYAAYCALSGELARRGASFPHGWNNPAHEQLPALIRNNLALLIATRRLLNRAVRRLRVARENADYRPAATVDRAVALACIRDAAMVLATLEILDG
jgi:uncharacterized protein (UPF0332 family)